MRCDAGVQKMVYGGREDGERLSENSHETVDNRVAIYIAQENTAFD